MAEESPDAVARRVMVSAGSSIPSASASIMNSPSADSSPAGIAIVTGSTGR